MNINKNHFAVLHPVTLLLYFISIITCVIACDYSHELICVFISLSIVVIYCEGLKTYAKSLIWYIILTIFTGIFNVFFNHSGTRVFLYVNDMPLTLDSLFYGLYTGIMVSCLLICFRLFNNFMDYVKLNFIIGRFFPVIGLVISMTFSLTKRFKIKARKIREARYSVNHEKRTFFSAADEMNILMNVMLKDSSVTADSMTARGYGTKHRKLYRRYQWGFSDTLTMIFIISLFTLSFFVKPTVVNLILIPVYCCIIKELLWKYYQSKI